MSDAAERLLRILAYPPEDDPQWPMVRRTLFELRPLLPTMYCKRSDTGWLLEAVDKLKDGAMAPAEMPAKKRQPRRGIITQYPVFSALVAQPVKWGSPLTVRRLQALYLLAVADREAFVFDKSFESSILSAGRACRNLASESSIDERVCEAVGAAYTPDDLADSVEVLAKAEKDWASEGSRKAVEGLRALMGYVRDGRTPALVKPGKRRSATSKASVHTLQSSEGEGARVQRYKLISETLPDSQRAELKSEGLSTTPENTRATLYTASPPSRNKNFPANTQTDYQANQRLILRARSFKSGVQPIPNRTDTLHDPALVPLIAPRIRWTEPLDPTQLAKVMLGAMLMLGCEAKHLGTMRVWSTRQAVPNDLSVTGLVGESQEFVLPVHALPDAWQPEREHRSRHRSTHPRLYLPIPTFLDIAQGLLVQAGQRCGQTLFGNTDFVADTQSAIKTLNEKHQTELTQSRLAKYLWSAAHALDGDVAEALLLSHMHRDSNDARLHYYAPARSHMAQQYLRIWQGLATRIGLHLPVQVLEVNAQDGYVGSAAVPRLRAIQATIDKFVDHTRRQIATRGRRSASQWVGIHNAMTVYVVRQIQWMTGMRAVRDPVELDLYDPASGYLGVIDKDSDDRYGARVVWLIEPVQEQIARYLQRVESATAAIFGHSCSTAAFRLIDPDSLEICQIDQQALLALTPDYPYAPNAHRHYMRTRLRELGVRAGFVDAWLGHGGVGREPYARHSALAPEQMRRAVVPALMHIWEELGWKVLPSQ